MAVAFTVQHWFDTTDCRVKHFKQWQYEIESVKGRRGDTVKMNSKFSVSLCMAVMIKI